MSRTSSAVLRSYTEALGSTGSPMSCNNCLNKSRSSAFLMATKRRTEQADSVTVQKARVGNLHRKIQAGLPSQSR